MTKPANESPDLDNLAAGEAQRWEGSSYYDQAEQWTWIFWSDSHPFLPLFRTLDLTYVVELACGHGRHGEKVLHDFHDRLGKLLMADILPSNIEHCKARIGRVPNASCFVNHGSDFRPVPDSVVSAVFCYDAMVHFNRKVVESYLFDTRRVLVPGGRALYHHSNYALDPDVDCGQNPHARAFMSAALFGKYAAAAGLRVVEQVPMSWGGSVDEIDCLTLLERDR
ncbi:MAG: class I SAM-dependent methyltransferase [Thermoanaerobaculia bacterium]|jgi:SAM-dependent methyltransferase